MNLYQYDRYAVIQLALEGVAKNTMALLNAIPVHLSMFCCKLKLFGIQMPVLLCKNAAVVDLRDKKIYRILSYRNKRLHTKTRWTVRPTLYYDFKCCISLRIR